MKVKFWISAAGVALASVAGASAAVGLVLPSHASRTAVRATAGVSLSSQSREGAGTTAEAGSPQPSQAFARCVVAHAEQASSKGGRGWNPTIGCTSPSHSSENASGSAGAGLGVASQNANASADAGLTTAAAGGSNGATHASTEGSGHAAAQGANATGH